MVALEERILDFGFLGNWIVWWWWWEISLGASLTLSLPFFFFFCGCYSHLESWVGEWVTLRLLICTVEGL